MKALLLTGKSAVEYREIETPKCPDAGFLMKIEAVGLCGSDVRTYTHGHSKVAYPCILGHENVGVVVKISPNIKNKNIKVGDRLVVNPAVPCGKCYYCLNNMVGLCEDLIVYGHSIPGGFAQYMAFPGICAERGQFIHIPDDVSSDEIVIVELLASVIKSQEQLGTSLGETVVIFGCGPIGVLQAQIAELRGATKIVMIDVNSKRLKLCEDLLGTPYIINSAEIDPIARVKEITNGRGADVVVVAAPVTEPHQQGLQMLRKQGRLSIFGGLNKENPWTKLDGNLIHYNRLTIHGSYAYSPANFQKGFDLVVSGKINKNIVTHRLPLKEMEKGVELIRTGEALKVILKPQIEE